MKHNFMEFTSTLNSPVALSGKVKCVYFYFTTCWAQCTKCSMQWYTVTAQEMLLCHQLGGR